MKRSVKKDIVRQVIHSPRRFVAILLIVMLGVAFFAGVRATCPDMRLTLDRYFDEYRASDVHLLSTYGFTDGDVAAVKEAGEGRYSPPTRGWFCAFGDSRLLVHFMSYDLNNPDGLCQPVLMEGRLPEKSDECVLDTRLTASGHYQIGDTLTIETKEDEGISDSLNTPDLYGGGNSPFHLLHIGGERKQQQGNGPPQRLCSIT